MPQETLEIDYQNLIREPSPAFKLYVFFLFIVCVVTCVKLIRIWIAVPPLRGSSKPPTPEYIALLRRSSRSLKQWIGSVVFSYLLFSIPFYGVGRDMPKDNRVVDAALSIALLVITVAFLARWHIVARVQRLGEEIQRDNC